MFKPIGAVMPNPGQPDARAPTDDGVVMVKRLFMLFHGWFGNLFLSKFSTGDLDAEGKDRGIKSAMLVWASELREFSPEVVMTAAQRCKVEHTQYPPTLPQFAALCRAAQPRKTMRAEHAGNRLGMSEELRSSYSRKARAEAFAKLKATAEARAGVQPLPDHASEGLECLKHLIAQAVAHAGGSEAGELARLDRLFAGAKA